MFKKLFFLLPFLAAIMSVNAQEGWFGDNNALHWEISGATLQISGTGAMPDFGPYVVDDIEYFESAPWRGYYISSMVVEAGITRVGNWTLHDSEWLTFVELASTVTSIGESAFVRNRVLNSIDLRNVVSIGNSAFQQCHSLTSVTFNSLQDIGIASFRDCQSLASITMGGDVQKIGDWAFGDCWRLEEITFSGPVSEIGNCAFISCPLKEIYLTQTTPPALGEELNSFENIPQTVILRIPAGAKEAYKAAAVWQDFGLILENGESLRAEGYYGPDNAFHWQLTNEGTLVVSGQGEMPDHESPWSAYRDEIQYVIVDGGLLAIVDTPRGIGEIGDEVFAGCFNLQKISIPISLWGFGYYALSRCSNLSEILISNNFSPVYWTDRNPWFTLENGILFNKDKTTLVKNPPKNSVGSSYSIPQSVTEIGEDAFAYCYELESLTIPSGVIRIKSYAFSSTHGLNSISLYWENPDAVEYGNDLFYNMSLGAVTLHVPAGTIAAYQSHPIWGSAGNIVEESNFTSHYQANAHSYPNTASFVANIVFNWVEQISNNLEIGAFAGSECRGSIILNNYPVSVNHPNLGFLTVHGNGGEAITFKVYDHNTGKEYEATNTAVEFLANAIYGDANTPYTVNIREAITQNVALSEGWSWISTNVTNETTPLIDQFKQNIGSNGVLLKGLDNFIQAPYWIGTLSNISNNQMYMVKTTAATALPFTSYPVNPAQTPIALQSGWNWIGYTPQASLSLNAALANLNPQEGDQIKSYSAYSTYTNANGWVGDLTTLSSGNGYKYFSNAGQSFVYPNAWNSSSSYYYISEEFNNPNALDNWTTTQEGNGGTASVSDGSLLLSTEGGSDGYMGKRDWIRLTPNYAGIEPCFRNVKYEFAVKENYIISNGYKENLEFGMTLSNKNTNKEIGITLHGRYNGYSFIDMSYDTYNKHTVLIHSDVDYEHIFVEELDLNAYYEYNFAVIQSNGEWTLQYKQKNSSEWKSIDITAAFGNQNDDEYTPFLTVDSGDGGFTRSNGKGSASIDYFRVSKVGNNQYLAPAVESEAVAPHWSVDGHRYPNTMTLTSVVLSNNEEWQSDQLEIGAFAGEECRGSVLLKNVEQIAGHPYLGFLVVYGENTSDIKLRVYDHSTGKEYDASNVLSFEVDAIYGNPAEPYKIVANTTGINSVQADIQVTQSGDRLEIHHPWNAIDNLNIVDLAGRTMVNSKSFNGKSIDISDLQSGIYLVKITKDGQSFVKKFIR